MWVWRCHIDLSTPNPRRDRPPRARSCASTTPRSGTSSSTCRPASTAPAEVNICPPAIDPLSPKNMALSPEDAALRLRPVRHRRGPAADVPGVALRPLEGPDRRDRRLPQGHRADARGAARAGGLDGHRRPRGLGVLQLDDGLRRRRPGHPHPQQPEQRGRDRGERLPVAGRRGDPEVHPRGLRAHGVGGALEGAALHRRRRGRHPAPGAGRRDRLPRLLARGVRRPLAADPARAGPRQAARPRGQGARAHALPHPAAPARLAAALLGITDEPGHTPRPRLESRPRHVRGRARRGAGAAGSSPRSRASCITATPSGWPPP